MEGGKSQFLFENINYSVLCTSLLLHTTMYVVTFLLFPASCSCFLLYIYFLLYLFLLDICSKRHTQQLF